MAVRNCFIVCMFVLTLFGASDSCGSAGTGSASDVVWSTFLGGNVAEDDSSNRLVAVDSSGCVYLAGRTESPSFSTTSQAYSRAFNGGRYDVFVTKLSADGLTVIYSTLLGGMNDESIHAISVDSSGCAYIAGETRSPDFPTTLGAIRTVCLGGDAFVTKLDAMGGLAYSTLLGGKNYDAAYAIAIGSDGCAYVTGFTQSSDFSITPGAFDEAFVGWYPDSFVTKLNENGTGLIYSTFIGGAGYDWANGIAVDSSGCVYLVGTTYSPDFPVTKEAFDTTYGGGSDVFVSKLSASGSNLVYSTFLGGSSDESASGIALDSSGCVYVAGTTDSSNFSITAGALSGICKGMDGFVAKLNRDGTNLDYSTYLGGIDRDQVQGIAVDRCGCAFVAGRTASSSFPCTSGAFDITWDGGDRGYDAFLAELNSSGTTLVYFTFLGGIGDEWIGGVVTDYLGNAYATGVTDSCDFPSSVGAFDINCGANGFVAKLRMPPVIVLRTSPANGGTTAPAVGDYSYSNNITIVALSASPSSGYMFDHWEGEVVDPNSPSSSVLMDGSKFITAVFVPSLPAMKRQSDNTSFTARSYIVSAVFPDYFYIESDNRECGIRVNKVSHGLGAGMRVDVEGTLKTNADGERYVEAISAVPNGNGCIKPIGLNNRALGGGDWFYDLSTGAGQRGVCEAYGLNNIGLLVRTSGTVSLPGESMFTIDDGGGVMVKCVVLPILEIDPSWRYVCVTGISSCERDGDKYIQILRVRDRSDIVVLR